MEKQSFKNLLESKTIKEIDSIINEFTILNNDEVSYKNLKKEDKIDLFLKNIRVYLDSFVKELTKEEYKSLKKILKIKIFKSSLLEMNELSLFSLLLKYNLGYKKIKSSGEFYYIYSDIKKELVKSVNKNNYKVVVNWNDKLSFIKGIINVFGIVKTEELINIFNKNYNIEKEELLVKLKKQSIIHEDYKLDTYKEQDYIYSGSFTSFRQAQKFIFEKDLDQYGYLVYIDYGNRVYKYNKEYKKLIKFIKHKYVFKKNDLKKFEGLVLNKYVDLYRINKASALKFLKENIKVRFEYKNKELENKLLEQIELVAQNEPKWVIK